MDDVEMADVEMDDAEGTFVCAACRRQRRMDDFVWLGSCDCQLCRSCLGSHAAAYWRHMAEQLQAEVQPHSDSKQKQHTSLHNMLRKHTGHILQVLPLLWGNPSGG